MPAMRIGLTGAAGFIGAKVAGELLDHGHEVVAIDNYDTTYPADIKHERIKRLQQRDGFRFIEGDIRSDEDVAGFVATQLDAIAHLAAQGGLRKSMDEPAIFISANISGFGNVIKAAVDAGITRLVYASSGAVYGGTPSLPFREDDAAAWPLSLYGATKRCDELLALTYAHGAGIRCTGLRFSTVYGTDGRPDMATYTFARRIAAGEPIDVHGQGKMVRDFLWGDDAAHSVVLAVEDEREFTTTPLALGPGEQIENAPWRVLNVATGRPVALMDMITLVEAAVGKPAELNLVDALAAEVRENRMDVSLIGETFGFTPSVQVEEGVPQAVEWYLDHLARHPAA